MPDRNKVIRTWEYILEKEKMGGGMRELIEETLKCLKESK